MSEGYSRMFISNKSIEQLTIHAISRHQKSVMPELKGEDQQKYLHVFIYHLLAHSGAQNDRLSLKAALQGQFQDKIEITQFTKKQQILKKKYYNDNLYYIITNDNLIDWAESFAENQRQGSDNTRKIFAVGILNKNEAIRKNKKKFKKIAKKLGQYQFFYDKDQKENYIAELLDIMNDHLAQRLRRQGQQIKTWNLSNKFKKKKARKNTSHVYYYESMEEQIEKIYHKSQGKMNNTWLQIHKYSDFRSIVSDIQIRAKMAKKEINNQATIIKNVTSKLIPQQNSGLNISSRNEAFSSRMLGSNFTNLNDTTTFSLSKSLKTLSKFQDNWILCPQGHEDLPKFRQFIKADKAKNWHLFQIDDRNNNFKKVLKDMIEKFGSAQQTQDQLLKDRIINSKTLIIICKSDDEQTIQMFKQQQNVLYNMEILTYEQSCEFSYFLRQGVRTFENFTIAIVPGQNGRPSGEYAEVINDFNQQYQNFNYVQNYEFRIQDSQKRMVRSRFKSNISLSPVSNINLNSNVFFKNNEQQPNYLDLRQLMEERDKNFHPFRGLKGEKVYLMFKSTKQKLFGKQFKLLADKRPRIQTSTYIDKSFLQEAIRLKKIKNDSVIVITDDDTLRQAQEAVKKFDQVYILNITDRKNVQNQIKVISHNTLPNILKLVQSIPENQAIKEFQGFTQSHLNDQLTNQRSYRYLPKTFDVSPSNNISIRMPADLNHPQSRKFEINLKKYFKDEIKFEYYDKPKDIRLTNKLEEPMTFIIVTKKYLDEMKKIAIHQKEQLRQEFLYYDENPMDQQKIIKEDKYQRFRFISNKWSRIYEYIVRTINPDPSTWIYQDEHIHIFILESNDMSTQMQNRLAQYKNSDDLNHKAAKRVWIHRFDDIKDTEQVLQQMYDRDKYYLFINEVSSQLNRQAGESQIELAKRYYSKKLQMLVLSKSIDPTIKKKKSQNIVKIQPTIQKLVKWVSEIQVRPVNKNISTPLIFIDNDSLDWFYFLDKYANDIPAKLPQTKKFQFQYLASKDSLPSRVNAIRQNDPKKSFWILTNDKKDSLTKYADLIRGIDQNQKIKFLIHGKKQKNQQFPQLRNSILFAHQDAEQIKAYIRNPFRTSNKIIFPSALNKKKVMLMVYDQPPMFIKLEEKRRWRNQLAQFATQVRTYDSIQRLLKGIQKYRSTNIFLVHDISSELKMQKTLVSYPDIKRIVLDRRRDVRNLGDKFVEGNNPIFYGTCPYEINNFLMSLRYNVKNPKANLKNLFNRQIYYILLQNKIKLPENVYTRLRLENDSIASVQGFQKGQLNSRIRDIYPEYQIVVIGDRTIEEQVLKNMENSDNISYLKLTDIQQMQDESDVLEESVIDGSNSDLVNQHNTKPVMQGTIQNLSTPSYQQIFAYLFNMPENRYQKASNNNKLNIVHFNEKSKQKFLTLFKKIEARNKALKSSTYTSNEQLLLNIQNKSKNHIRNIIVVQNEEQQKQLQNFFKDKKNAYNLVYFILGDGSQRNISTKQSLQYWFITKDKKSQFKSVLNNTKDQFKQENQNPFSLYPPDFDQMLDKKEFKLPKISSIQPVKTNYSGQNQGFDIKGLAIPNKPQKLDPADSIRINDVVDFKQNILNIPDIEIKADRPPLPILLKEVTSLTPKIQPLTPRFDNSPANPIFSSISLPSAANMYQFPIAFPLPPPPPPKVKVFLAYPRNDQQLQQISKMWKRNLNSDPLKQNRANNHFQISLKQYANQNQLKKIQSEDFDKMVLLNKNDVWQQPKYQSIDPNRHNFNRVLKIQFDDEYDRVYADSAENFLSPYYSKDYQNIPYQNKRVSNMKTNQIKLYLPQNMNSILKQVNPRIKQQDMTSVYTNKHFIERDENKKYVEIINYSSVADLENKLYPTHGKCIHFIFCSLKDYNLVKFLKIGYSRRFIFVIAQSIKEDKMYLDRHFDYSYYIGPNGIEALKNLLTKIVFADQDDIEGVIFYRQNEPIQRHILFKDQKYLPFEKAPYQNEHQLFFQMDKIRYTRHKYRLIVNQDFSSRLVKLSPKIYLEKNRLYQNDFVENYHQGGFIYSTKILTKTYISHKQIEQARNMHDQYTPSKLQKAPKNLNNKVTELFRNKYYRDLDLKGYPFKYYGDAKDLEKQLKGQDSPCMIVYDSSNLGIKKLQLKLKQKHIFEQVEDYKERWILHNGILPEISEDERLQWKQLIFSQQFNQTLFNTYNDMQFFYLSNKAQTDQIRNILLRTKEELLSIYQDPANKDLLMIIFVEEKDANHIHPQMRKAASKKSSRVRLIFLKTSFDDNRSRQELIIKFNEIDPVIYCIRRIQNKGRNDYVLYQKGVEGQRQLIRTLPPGHKKQFSDVRRDIKQIAQKIKGDFRIVNVICFQEDISLISSILASYSIKTKQGSDEQVNFIPIRIINESKLSGGGSVSPTFPNENQTYIANNSSFIHEYRNLSPNQRATRKEQSSEYYKMKENPIHQNHDQKYSSYYKNVENSTKVITSRRIMHRQIPSIQQIQNVNTSKDGDYIDIQRYQYFRILYSSDLHPSIKRRLIQLSQNPNVFPTLYKNIESYQKLQNDPKNLTILLMKSLPNQLRQQINKEDKQSIDVSDNISIVLQKKILKGKEKSFEAGKILMSSQLSTILQEQLMAEDDQYHQDQATLKAYLTMIQKQEQKNRHFILQKIKKMREFKFEEKQATPNKTNYSNLTQNHNLNIVSKIRTSHQNLSQQQIQGIRRKIKDRPIVLLIQTSKKAQYETIFEQFSFLVQMYTNELNLENFIRDKRSSLLIAIVSRQMLSKIQSIKRTYPNVIYILENLRNDQIPDKYAELIDGQLLDVLQLKRLLNQITKQNEKQRLNKITQQVPITSKVFQTKKGSMIDFNNTERFIAGLGNTRTNRVNIFYRDNKQFAQLVKRMENFKGLNAKYIPYDGLIMLKQTIAQYTGYSVIVIVYGKQVQEVQDFLAKKEHIYVIRFKVPSNVKQIPTLKYLINANSIEQLENFFIRYLSKGSDIKMESKLTPKKYEQRKNYKIQYPPNSFGTSQRLSVNQHYVPKSRDKSVSVKKSLDTKIIKKAF